MGISPGAKLRDKLLYVVDNHAVMYDKFQIVIQHPKTCPGKGSSLDRRKTFHRWPLALEKLDTCQVVLTPDQQGQLTYQGQQVDVAPR